MNLNYQTNLIMKTRLLSIAFIAQVFLVACDGNLPDPIEPRVELPGDPVVSESLEGQVQALPALIEDLIDYDQILTTASESSNEKANELATELTEINALYDQLQYIARIPTNSEVNNEPISGTNAVGDVSVYSYSLTTLNAGQPVTTYVQYQIEEREDQFIHTLFSGDQPKPTNQVAQAVVMKEGFSGTININFGTSNTVQFRNNEQGEREIEIGSGETIRVITIKADDSLSLVRKNGGQIVSQTTWSPAGYGIFNGEVVIENFQTLNLWQYISSLQTISSASDDVHQGVMAMGLINPLTKAEPYFEIPASVVISTGQVDGNAATLLNWEGDSTSFEYSFYFDAQNRYHQIAENDSILYSATENRSTGEGILIGGPGVETPDGFWTYQYSLQYSFPAQDSILLIGTIPHPNSWTSEAIGRFFTIQYNSDDLSGTLLDQHANKAQYEAGNPWGNAYWHNSSWNANAVAGSYTHKNVFDWGGNSQFEGSWPDNN
jgi:hypothetical protein